MIEKGRHGEGVDLLMPNISHVSLSRYIIIRHNDNVHAILSRD